MSVATPLPVPTLEPAVPRRLGLWAALAPLALAVVLFGLNSLTVWAGLARTPEGHEPSWLPRNGDTAQYLTWIEAARSNVLVPNYHAPWATEPALLNPTMLALARISGATGADPRILLLGLHFLFYVHAAYALWFALRQFTEGAAQRHAAMAAAIMAVPVQCLLALPAAPFGLLPGIGDFVWWSSDGLFHGIAASPLVTLGTGNVLLAFGLLARHLRTGHALSLRLACAVALASGALHPFEVVVIAGGGGLALLFRRRVAAAMALGVSGFLGLAPYVWMTWRSEWLRAAAADNHWTPYPPWRLLLMMGLPMMLGLWLWLSRPRGGAPIDLLLRCWVGFTLVAVYLPGMPHSQHFLDGVHYAGAMLAAREVARRGIRIPRALVAAGLALSLGACILYWRQSWRDGGRPQPERLFSGVAPVDEAGAARWLKTHGSPHDLVLAPPEHAPWFAAVPMHSLASHYLFSLTYREQAAFSREFFSGAGDPNAMRAALAKYGVRYVVLEEGSPARRYLEGKAVVAEAGKLRILELPGAGLKPYYRLR